ncbi:MAG TPA: AraC family transcriptional regulator, partial [Casimicrobium sp.]|nr:AraC family transcriptional regulator [Casimicrobium sp.]
EALNVAYTFAMFDAAPSNVSTRAEPALPQSDSPYTDLAPARLWLPRASLTACIRAVVARSSVGVALDEPQRYNHFPAYPGCSIAWLFEGSVEMLEPGYAAHASSPRLDVPGRVYFCGPFTRPTITFNSPSAHGMMILLQPDAFSVLTGKDSSEYLNRVVAADTVFDGQWHEMFRAVQDAADDDERVTILQDFLQPRWALSRPKSLLGSHLLQDWFRGAAQYFALSGLGRSLRQLERRFKRNTGLSMRELRSLSRSENAFYVAARESENGKLGAPRWADVADEGGYADQSHMCRESRRVTGFSPEELYRLMCTEESFWMYRLWALTPAPQPTPKDRRYSQ